MCAEAERGPGAEWRARGEGTMLSPLGAAQGPGWGSLLACSWSISCDQGHGHCQTSRHSTYGEHGLPETVLKGLWAVALPYAAPAELKGFLSSCCVRGPGTVFYAKVDFFHRALFRWLGVIKSEVLVFVLLPKCLRYFLWSILRWPDWHMHFFSIFLFTSLSYLLPPPFKPSLCRHWHLHDSWCGHMVKLLIEQAVYNIFPLIWTIFLHLFYLVMCLKLQFIPVWICHQGNKPAS